MPINVSYHNFLTKTIGCSHKFYINIAAYYPILSQVYLLVIYYFRSSVSSDLSNSLARTGSGYSENSGIKLYVMIVKIVSQV